MRNKANIADKCCSYLYKFRYWKLIIVRLSLLAMTSLNQMREALHFVFSNMADETNLSSKLPVADRS